MQETPSKSSSRLFSDGQLEEIHRASLKLLQQDGILVQSPGASELLRRAGCEIGDNGRVRIPPEIIDRALASTPSRIDLYSRTGELRMELGSGKTYFGPGADLPNNMDLVGSERRPSVLADVRAYSRLCDLLENLDFVMSMALSSDVQDGGWDRQAFLAMLESTVKPIVFTARDLEGLADIIQMAEVVAGSAESLAAKPFLMASVTPSLSRVLAPDDVGKMDLLTEKGLPWVLACGLTVEEPVAATTVQPAIVEANAHALSVVTFAQLQRPGSPMVLGAEIRYCGPEAGGTASSRSTPLRQGLGWVELFHHRYGLPVWGSAGVSDSKLPDIQAGIESAVSIIAAESSGADLISGVGSLESGEMGSFEMVVVADEIIGFVRQLTGDDESAKPSLFDHSNHQGWIESGRPNMIRSARDRAIELIGSHESQPLPGSVAGELEALVLSADQDSHPDE